MHVPGRYLMLRKTDRPGVGKRGFIDSESYGAHTLDAMCANVSVLEQLCDKAQGSVVDYEADGTTIRCQNDIKTQSRTRERVQAGCLKFQQWAGVRRCSSTPRTKRRSGARARHRC